MRNHRVSCTHPMHFFFCHLESYQIRGVARWLALPHVPEEPGENPSRHRGERANSLGFEPTAASLNFIVPRGRFARGYQERRCRVIACINSWMQRYDGMETKTCVIRVQFMAHFATQQKGARVYISFTRTHPYMSRPQTSFGRRSWLRCSED